jgi:hypothetical protein
MHNLVKMKIRRTKAIITWVVVIAFLFQQVVCASPPLAEAFPISLGMTKSPLGTEKVPASFLLDSSYGKKNAGTFSFAVAAPPIEAIIAGSK